MIIRQVDHGPNRGYGIQELSNEEKERLEEIFEEIRVIFNAESVGLEEPTPTLSRKSDYVIHIFNGDTMRHVLE